MAVTQKLPPKIQTDPKCIFFSPIQFDLVINDRFRASVISNWVLSTSWTKYKQTYCKSVNKRKQNYFGTTPIISKTSSFIAGRDKNA